MPPLTSSRGRPRLQLWPTHLIVFLSAIVLVVAFCLVLTYRVAYILEHPADFDYYDVLTDLSQRDAATPLWRKVWGQRAKPSSFSLATLSFDDRARSSTTNTTTTLHWSSDESSPTAGRWRHNNETESTSVASAPQASRTYARQQQQSARDSGYHGAKVRDDNQRVEEVRTTSEESLIPPPNGTHSPMIHLVFSTGCSLRQDWQSYAFFYHAMLHQPEARVTRVASGCTNETLAQELFDAHIRPMSPHNFHLHLTPEYGKLVAGETYKFFNKPFGLRHWMEHALRLGDADSPHLSDVIVLMDPDQLLIRPFAVDYTNEPELYPPGPKLHRKVSDGHPMAQRYGFGAHFTHTTRLKRLVPEVNATLDGALPLFPRPWESAPVEFYYVAGPPYLATGRDWWSLVRVWAAVVVPLYRQTLEFMAEMYAYSTAAWLLNLPHQLVNSFMVSNVDSGGEAWPWIDGWDDRDAVCDVDNNDNPSSLPLPHVLHYCQRYHQGPWFFSKYNLPTDFVSCHHSLLKVPSSSSDILEYSTSRLIDGKPVPHISVQHRRRYSFMLCHLLKRMNRVARHYKDRHCPQTTEPGRGGTGGEESNTTITNYGETYVWPQFVDQPLPPPSSNAAAEPE